QAQFGQVRCLRKLGQLDDAIGVCHDILESGHGDRGAVAYLRATAQLLLVELLNEKAQQDPEYTKAFYAELLNLFGTLTHYNTGGSVLLDIASDQRVFLAERAFGILDRCGRLVLDERFAAITEGVKHNS